MVSTDQSICTLLSIDAELFSEAEEDPTCLAKLFKPSKTPVPMGQVFQSCGYVMREGWVAAKG